MKTGSLLSALLFAAVVVAAFVPGAAEADYEPAIAFRLCAVYVLELLLTLVYEWIRRSKDKWGKQLTRELKAERDEMAVMKDNLKTGFFLMDRLGAIQGQYSRAMDEILCGDHLQGRTFTELLSSSLSAKERELLTDYFSMIFEGAIDRSMLEDMNPLQEFTYTPAETKHEKTLRVFFAPVEKEGERFILGNIQDVTAETLLQKRLAREENKRQDEMVSLFQIMQVDRAVFDDFIEDTDYEFGRMNGALKKTGSSSADILVDLYQSVHAIKSNALILGLDQFSGKLHNLESELKDLRGRETIPFEDMLHITVEIGDLMQEKDSFRNTVEKIRAFTAGEGQIAGEADVFLETLKRAAERAAADLGKTVRFEIAAFDRWAVQTGRRRVMKEALTQLVRNAVYHGIETPEERREAGKDEAGVITLSLTMEGPADAAAIRVGLGDDGQGVDLNRIHEKAASMGLVSEEPVSDEALLQLLFEPGFSTAATESLHAGRGMGLSLVRERLQEEGGTITLHSAPGRGTTFAITLPAASSKSESA
jgi:two-component system chemotaxis sensor kinase CheA